MNPLHPADELSDEQFPATSMYSVKTSQIITYRTATATVRLERCAEFVQCRECSESESSSSARMWCAGGSSCGVGILCAVWPGVGTRCRTGTPSARDANVFLGTARAVASRRLTLL